MSGKRLLSRVSQNARQYDARFQQLLALAREGNDEAKADLFKEYEFVFSVEAPRHVAD